MDVFSLRDSVVGEYKKFATSFTTIHAEDIRQQVDTIYAQERYWPEPLIQINPSYRQSTSVDQLVVSGDLHPTCAEIFCYRRRRRSQAAEAVQAPAAGDCAGGRRRELRGDHRHGLGQVALLLHPDRQRGAQREGGWWRWGAQGPSSSIP